MTIPPLRIFFSYHDRDAGHIEELLKHLSFIKDEYSLEYWHRGQVQAGEDWQQRGDSQLENADIVLIAVTPDFFSSPRCRDIELTRALARQATDGTRVLPIIVRPSQWESSPLGHLEPLPRGGKAVSTWGNPDEAWLDVARGLQRIVSEKREAARLSSENRRLRDEVDRLQRNERELTSHCTALTQELNRLRGGPAPAGDAARPANAVAEMTAKVGQMHSELEAQRRLAERLAEQRQEQQAVVNRLREELRIAQRTIEALTLKTMARAEIVACGANIHESNNEEICWVFRVWNLGDGSIRLLRVETNWRVVPQHESATTATDLFAVPVVQEFPDGLVLQPGGFSEPYEVRINTRTLGRPGGDIWIDLVRPAILLHIKGVHVNVQTSILRVLERGTEVT